MFERLESPGTKSHSQREAQQRLSNANLTNVRTSTRLCPGDLLTMMPSERYQARMYRLAWRLYPRWLIRLFGHRFGLQLLITARKP